MAIGLWREKDGWATEDSVRVRYPNGAEMDIPASDYRANGYEPLFETLPWKPEDAKRT